MLQTLCVFLYDLRAGGYVFLLYALDSWTFSFLTFPFTALLVSANVR